MKVGWESAALDPSKIDTSGTSVFWVFDCGTSQMGTVEEDNVMPAGAAMVKLAASTEERCGILKRMGAIFYPGMEQYKAESTFLRAWEWKWEGEIRHLKKVDS